MARITSDRLCCFFRFFLLNGPDHLGFGTGQVRQSHPGRLRPRGRAPRQRRPTVRWPLLLPCVLFVLSQWPHTIQITKRAAHSIESHSVRSQDDHTFKPQPHDPCSKCKIILKRDGPCHLLAWTGPAMGPRGNPRGPCRKCKTILKRDGPHHLLAWSGPPVRRNRPPTCFRRSSASWLT